MPDQPRTISVAYRTPHERATRDASATALAFVIALGVAVIPLLIVYLQKADYSRETLIALVSAIGVAALTVALSYLITLSRAMSSDPVYQTARTERRRAAAGAQMRVPVARYDSPAPAPTAFVMTPAVPVASGKHP